MRFRWLFLVALLALLIPVASASAKNGRHAVRAPQQWYHHSHAQGNGNPCDRSATQHGNDDVVTGPFTTRALCEASGGNEPPPPVDVCPNIAGNQATVPEGLVLVDGQCVTPTVTPPGGGGGGTGGTGGTGGGGGLTLTPPALGGAGVGTYMCYSHFGVETNAAAFSMAQAQSLWKQGGWFLAVAVPGNDPSGNNIDGYHIVCNPASTRVATGLSLGGSGETYSAFTQAAYNAEYNPDLGNYAIYK